MAYLPRVPANAPQDFQISVINQIIDELNSQQRTQVLTDSTTSRYLFGFQQNGWPAGSFGIKISQPGKDVTTAAYSDLLFYWDFTSGTMYWNDSTGRNYRQDGTLPDGTNNLVIVQDNTTVAQAF
jgi:hypothetical protein